MTTRPDTDPIPYATPRPRSKTPAWVWLIVAGGVAALLLVGALVLGVMLFSARAVRSAPATPVMTGAPATAPAPTTPAPPTSGGR